MATESQLLLPKSKSSHGIKSRSPRPRGRERSAFLEEYNIYWLRFLPAFGVSFIVVINVIITSLAVALGHTTFAFDAGGGVIHQYTILTPAVSLCHNHSPEMYLFPIGSCICVACLLASFPLLYRMLLGSIVKKTSEAKSRHYFICYFTLALGAAAFLCLTISSCVPLQKNALFQISGFYSGGVSKEDLYGLYDPTLQSQIHVYAAVGYFTLAYCHCVLVFLLLLSKHIYWVQNPRFQVSTPSLILKFICLVMHFVPSNYFFLMFWRPTNIPSSLKADTFRAHMNASGLMQRFIIAHHIFFFASYSADFYWLKELD